VCFFDLSGKEGVLDWGMGKGAWMGWNGRYPRYTFLLFSLGELDIWTFDVLFWEAKILRSEIIYLSWRGEGGEKREREMCNLVSSKGGNTHFIPHNTVFIEPIYLSSSLCPVSLVISPKSIHSSQPASLLNTSPSNSRRKKGI
jgi:hypothetical protein